MARQASSDRRSADARAGDANLDVVLAARARTRLALTARDSRCRTWPSCSRGQVGVLVLALTS